MSALSSVPPLPLSTSPAGIAVQPDPPPAAVQTVSPVADAAAAAEPEERGGFSIRFDSDMHRLVLELRDRLTGEVTFQVPPKAAARRMEATAGSTAAGSRGHTVNGSA
jgi:hypothetical protein